VESGLWWIHVESLKRSEPVSELLLSEPASALTSNPSKPSYCTGSNQSLMIAR